MKASKIVIVAIFASVFFFSCASAPSLYEHRLVMLSKAPKPVTILAVSRDSAAIPSVTFRDAKGRIFVIVDDGLGTMKPGDVVR